MNAYNVQLDAFITVKAKNEKQAMEHAARIAAEIEGHMAWSKDEHGFLGIQVEPDFIGDVVDEKDFE